MCKISEKRPIRERKQKNTEGRVREIYMQCIRTEAYLYNNAKNRSTMSDFKANWYHTCHDTPNLWNISSRVLNATGLTRLQIPD
jgi:hypothetical protein